MEELVVGVGLGLGFGLGLGVGVDGLSFSSFSSSGSVVEDSLSLEELLRSTTVKVMVLPGIKSNRFAFWIVLSDNFTIRATR